ncbi:hypothetical protein [Nocardioides donggukensis]|uniref:WXG100 family type VII secretion target n=1 Tax=Nocardioides donggukensis TaxID=2774019 RepID=A0A927K586_9ACTN|nr:hypothetical protein [Nocardioides donggukensis]MBD8870502.1 hypothetical protein [Nocardioides donggukensis]
MSSRSADWSVVHQASDPVPADEWDVKRVAGQYRDRGEDLGSSRSTLQRLSQLSGWTGEAAEEFAKKAADRVDDLGKAADKYLQVADALTTYAGHVGTARTDTWDGLQRALDAEEQRRRLDQDPLEGVAEPTPEQLVARSAQWDRRDDAESARRRAAQDVEDAVERLRQRASECADDIKEASEKFSDGWFDHVKGWVRDHADLIRMIVDVLKWVALAVAAIGIVVALFFTAPLWITALIVGVGVALAAAILAGDALLLSVGEATWGDIAWDTAGLLLAAVGGRATIRAAQALPGTLSRARDVVVVAQRAQAVRSLPRHVRWFSRINPARSGLLGGLRNYAQARHLNAVDDAVTRVDQMLRVDPSVWARLRVLDSGAATALEKIRVMRSFRVPAAAAYLDEAAANVRRLTYVNWAGFATGADAALGRATGVSPADVPKQLVDEIVDEASDLRWRLSAIR